MRKGKQLELNLTPRAGPPMGSKAAWRYWFTDDGLIEEGGGTRYLYGLWSRQFGCWEVSTVNGAFRECLPTGVFLRPGGNWFGNDRIRPALFAEWAGERRAGWRFEANAAFAAFYADIPASIRQPVSYMGKYQWIVLDMIWQVPTFARFLEVELSLCHQQFLFACFALVEADSASRTRRRLIAEALLTRRRHDLLAALTGFPCGKTTVRVLYKLGRDPLPRTVYRNLIAAMTVPSAAKVLQHADSLVPDLPEVLLRVPESLRLANLFALCHPDYDDCSAGALVKDLDKILSRVAPDERLRCIAGLRALHGIEDFLEWQARWQSRIWDRSPFPPPPIPGDDLLQPITDNPTLRRESLVMRNCVRDMADQVLANRVFFYHWSGAEPATVALYKVSDRDWVLGQALGRGNADLDPWTHYVIAERVWHQRGIVLGRWGEPPPFPGGIVRCLPGHSRKAEVKADAA